MSDSKVFCHDCDWMPGKFREDFPYLFALCDYCHEVRKCWCRSGKLGQNAGGGWKVCETCSKWLTIQNHVISAFSSCMDSAFHLVKRGGPTKRICKHGHARAKEKS